MCGALTRSFESRTATPPPGRCATSTQLPAALALLLNQCRSASSLSIRFLPLISLFPLFFCASLAATPVARASSKFVRRLRDHVGGRAGGEGRRDEPVEGLGPQSHLPVLLEIDVACHRLDVGDLRVGPVRELEDRERTA